MDRKAQLEKKRKKLEELRKVRESRSKILAASDEVAINAKIETPPAAPAEAGRHDVEDLVSSLIGSSTLSPTTADAEKETSEADPPPTIDHSVDSSDIKSTALIPQRKLNLSMHSCAIVSISPVLPPELYSKEIQTEESALRDEAEQAIAEVEEAEIADVSISLQTNEIENIEELNELAIEEGTIPPPSLSEEEIAKIMSSEKFASFIDRAARVVERALGVNERYDIAVDYSDFADDKSDTTGIRGLSVTHCFVDAKIAAAGRTVTSLDWSPKHSELFLASYGGDRSTITNSSGADGVVMLWNMHARDRPEYTLQCQSPVLSASFARFHSHLVIGATYSGQLVMWDVRSSRRTPVQRSPLSSAGHTHPVYSSHVVGTQNAHSLFTVSTDGRACAWSLDTLTKPHETFELEADYGKALAAMCTSFPDNDINNFVVGTEEGVLYQACRYGSKAGVMGAMPGHGGPITGVHVHPTAGAIDFSDLVLTSSVDWTVKLWSMRSRHTLHTFESGGGDYVYDVRWSPTHPSVFASVDAVGRLDVWDISSVIEEPAATEVVGGGGNGGVALNCLRWSSDGQHIIVGDSTGTVSLVTVGEQLTTPRADAWSHTEAALADLKL